MKAIENLQRAIDTYKERNKVYGDNYLHFGEVMEALFPQGISLSSQHDWNRLGVFIQIMSKLTRYCADFNKPHIDSIHDMGVYCFMQEELDAEQFEEIVLEDFSKHINDPLRIVEACTHVYREGRCVNPLCDELDPSYVRHAVPVQRNAVRIAHPFAPIREGSDICKSCGGLEGFVFHTKPTPIDPFKQPLEDVCALCGYLNCDCRGRVRDTRDL